MSRNYPDPLVYDKTEWLATADPATIPASRQFGSGSWNFQNQGNPTPDVTTLTGTWGDPFPKAKPGATFLFWLEWDNYQLTDVVSMSDTEGNTYTVAHKDGVVGKVGMALVYSRVQSNGASIHWTATINAGKFWFAAQLTGEWGLGALDKVASAPIAGTTAALTTPSITPTNAQSLVLARWASNHFAAETNLVPGDSANDYLDLAPRSINNPNATALWEQGLRKFPRTNAPVSASATAPFSSDSWVGIIASFKLDTGFAFTDTDADIFDLKAQSWAAWVKPTAASLDPLLVFPVPAVWNPGSMYSPYIDFTQGAFQVYCIDDNDGSYKSSTGNVTFAADEWVLLAYTWNPGDKKIHLYINGAEVSYANQDTFVGSPERNYAGTDATNILNMTSQFIDFGDPSGGAPLGPFVLGADLFGDNIGGKIGESAIWKRALTSLEMAAAGASTTGLAAIGAADLVAYWHLCGKSNPETDSAGDQPLIVSNVPDGNENTPGYTCPTAPTIPGPFLGSVVVVGSEPTGDGPFLGSVSVISDAPAGQAAPYRGRVVLGPPPSGKHGPHLGQVVVVTSAPDDAPSDPFLGTVESV